MQKEGKAAGQAKQPPSLNQGLDPPVQEVLILKQHMNAHFHMFRNYRNKDERPYHGFQRHLDRQAKQSEITVFVRESDGKQLSFAKSNFTQFVNRKVKILGGRLDSPS